MCSETPVIGDGVEIIVLQDRVGLWSGVGRDRDERAPKRRVLDNLATVMAGSQNGENRKPLRVAVSMAMMDIRQMRMLVFQCFMAMRMHVADPGRKLGVIM